LGKKAQSREVRSVTLSDPIKSVQWSPKEESILGVSSAWKIFLYKKQKMLMTHVGHRYAVDDFKWNQYSETSTEIGTVAMDLPHEGGSTMQIWRPSLDLLRDFSELLDNMKDFLKDEASYHDDS
jgi:hypothetical protein